MRRRRREQAITLFAFQDIITGVAGVMLFILLLLVVQLTTRVVVAAQQETNESASQPQTSNEPETPREAFVQAKQELSDLKEQLEQLKRENESLLESSGENVDQMIADVQQQLAELIRQADQLREQAQAIKEEVANQTVSPERQSILDRRSALERQLEALEEERERHAGGKLVAFKSNSRNVKDMWVVDLKDVAATVFDVQDPLSATVVTYDRQTSPMVVATMVKKRMQQSTKTRSIVLVLRPSVAGKGDELIQAFRSAGMNVALELLDEDTLITSGGGS